MKNEFMDCSFMRGLPSLAKGAGLRTIFKGLRNISDILAK